MIAGQGPADAPAADHPVEGADHRLGQAAQGADRVRWSTAASSAEEDAGLFRPFSKCLSHLAHVAPRR